MPLKCPAEFFAPSQEDKSIPIIHFDLWEDDSPHTFVTQLHSWVPKFKHFLLVANTSDVIFESLKAVQGVEVNKQSNYIVCTRKGLFK
jgi:hypothetical protein